MAILTFTITSVNFSTKVRHVHLYTPPSLLSWVLAVIPYWHAEGSFDAAEPFLLAAGKRDSARLVAEMFLEWAGPEGPAGAFALRGTLP